jgi:predicted aldo/keto reductase-like oxidoreductase
MSAEEQLAENLRIAEASTPGMFTAQENDFFRPVRAAIEKSYKIPCTGCNYCMPCPKRVNIPAVFAAYNISYAIGYFSGMASYLTSIASLKAGDNFSARNCVRCGQCVKKCPQHIAIPDELNKVAKRLEPFWVQALIKIASKFMS